MLWGSGQCPHESARDGCTCGICGTRIGMRILHGQCNRRVLWYKGKASSPSEECILLHHLRVNPFSQYTTCLKTSQAIPPFFAMSEIQSVAVAGVRSAKMQRMDG